MQTNTRREPPVPMAEARAEPGRVRGTPARDAAFHPVVTRAVNTLQEATGHSPTVVDVALHLLSSAEEVVAALDADDVGTTAPPLPELHVTTPEPEIAPGSPLASAVAHLSGVARRVVVLRFGHRLSQAEISRRLHLLPSEVSMVLARSVRQLRRIQPTG